MGSVNQGYRCILLYMKLMWCSCVLYLYGGLEEGVGVNIPWVYVQSSICETFWCSGFPEIYTQLEEGVGSVCHGYMCILLYVKLICCSCVA